ncbi:hypothetical protein B0A75_18135 [Flavobacterium oncorhynchi]|uniref:Uncharacterized protein n=1 Tax=Flavobacterium oncorhynchi TaxID=728056 RepID=A0A226HP58_9FLAO|nr:hypothetical protein [Flavobacterium oncorhynchi]OXA95985.1 hypothetical protein B0A75_18135 [Flavobacterium oncorhynchi]
MGFFKNIGKAIKKNVSFKNLVKIATPIMGAIPIVGGAVQNVSQKLQDAHQAKKDAQNAQNEYDRQVAEANALALQQQAYQTAGQTIGAGVNAGASMFAKGVTEGMYAGASTGVKEGLGTVGAEVADSTIKAWFKKHWKHILIGLSIIGAIYLIKKHNDDKNPRRRFQRRR